MPRLSLRYLLGIITVLAFAVMGYAMFRSRDGFSTTPAVSARSVSSTSGPGEWSMEGYDPARTRALPKGIALPVTRQREVLIRGDDGAGSPITIAQNTLLVETDHLLRALDLRTLKQRWSFEQQGRQISPAVAGSVVYIRAETANQGQIFALNLADGTQRWSFTPRRLSSAVNGFWGGHLTSPVVADGIVFVGAGKEVYALKAASGEVQWEQTGADYIASSPTVADGLVFISDAKNLRAIDQHTGKLVWSVPAQFSIYFSPIVSNQAVYYTDGAKVIALDTRDGKKRWETDYPGENLLPSAAQGDRLFIKSAARLYALDQQTGKEIWRFDHPNFVSFPAVAGDQMFAVTGATGQTALTVIDARTGKRVAQHPIPTLATTAPVIAGETLYVRTTDGRILGLYN